LREVAVSLRFANYVHCLTRKFSNPASWRLKFADYSLSMTREVASTANWRRRSAG
jgi:hypothetical protein